MPFARDSLSDPEDWPYRGIVHDTDVLKSGVGDLRPEGTHAGLVKTA